MRNWKISIVTNFKSVIAIVFLCKVQFGEVTGYVICSAEVNVPRWINDGRWAVILATWAWWAEGARGLDLREG